MSLYLFDVCNVLFFFISFAIKENQFISESWVSYALFVARYSEHQEKLNPASNVSVCVYAVLFALLCHNINEPLKLFHFRFLLRYTRTHTLLTEMK